MKLSRIRQDDFATYGVITDDAGNHVCYTLELPWLNNAHGISCIPTGLYHGDRFQSPHRATEVWKLRDVPGRGDIELHTGNLPHDTEGCILLGTLFGSVNGQPGVTGSAAAFKKFMEEDTASLEELVLEVINALEEGTDARNAS